VKELSNIKEILVSRMKETIHFFLNFLQVTRGDLAPEKGAWFFITYHWKYGKSTLIKPKDSHRGIELQSKSNGTHTTLKWKAPEDRHHILGFHLNGDGSSNGHRHVMTAHAILYGEAIAWSTPRRGENSLAYSVFYMKSLAYGTPATFMPFKDCHNMQKPVVNTILPKLGINRKEV
jgi:hypothetical protein